jgi:phage shock protein PspC (stress-responsive transcriptional regulator)
MNTVIIINLNGNAYHVEEAGFQALQAYLAAAQAQLKDNPDKAEIMADLEQAIADKCAPFLRSHKNVLSASEIDDVLKQMGPVQTDAPSTEESPKMNTGSSSNSTASGSPAPKRLYQIREGAMISGVCTGLAAYFDVDVVIVRIAFVILALLTHGAWGLVYIAMMFVIPFANTDEEHSAARGATFSAQDVIDRAKQHYSEFKDSKEWRKHWREQRREWRRRWREGSYWWGHNLQRNVHQASTRVGYTGQVFAGLMIPVLAVLSGALFFAGLVALVTLATTGALFGVAVTAVPLWVAILILIFVYNALAWPLQHARRSAYFVTGGHHTYPWVAAWDGILRIGFFCLVAWFAYRYVPAVHDFIAHFNENVQLMWNNIQQSWHTTTVKPPAELPQVEPK